MQHTVAKDGMCDGFDHVNVAAAGIVNAIFYNLLVLADTDEFEVNILCEEVCIDPIGK